MPLPLALCKLLNIELLSRRGSTVKNLLNVLSDTNASTLRHWYCPRFQIHCAEKCKDILQVALFRIEGLTWPSQDKGIHDGP